MTFNPVFSQEQVQWKIRTAEGMDTDESDLVPSLDQVHGYPSDSSRSSHQCPNSDIHAARYSVSDASSFGFDQYTLASGGVSISGSNTTVATSAYDPEYGVSPKTLTYANTFDGSPSSNESSEATETLLLADYIDIVHTYTFMPHLESSPSDLSSEDLEYLRRKGALNLPSRQLLQGLLDAFVSYVYPFLPILDLQDFLQTLQQDLSQDQPALRPGSKTSLIVIQGVLFSATGFVDQSLLQQEGFTSRKQAREHYFRKVKLLYDFGHETSRIAIIQALLLMTFWQESMDDEKDASHWIGVAFSQAHTVGMEQAINESGEGSKKQKQWRRIWWSIFVRDALVALGTRRSPRIDLVSNPRMLQVSDFDFCTDSSALAILADSFVVARDVETQHQFANMFIALAQLCIHIRDTLDTQYSVHTRSDATNTSRSIVMLSPSQQPDGTKRKQIEDALTLWELRFLELHDPRWLDDTNAPIHFHQAVLHMLYNATAATLYRPTFQALSTTPYCRKVSRLSIANAASRITKSATDLYNLSLHRFLPASGITVIMVALMAHVAELQRSQGQAERETHIGGIRLCFAVLNELRDIYNAADDAVALANALPKELTGQSSGVGIGSAKGTEADLTSNLSFDETWEDDTVEAMFLRLAGNGPPRPP